MATSPYGGTTSLPQYLQQRQPTTEFGAPKPAASTPATTPTVTPPATTAPSAPTAPAAPKPQIGTGGNFGTPAPAPPAITPTPYPVSGTGNPTIPTAPPPPAATTPFTGQPAVEHVPGATGQTAPGGPVPLTGLRGLLEQMLGNSNRYDDATVQKLRESQQGQLQDTLRTEEDRLKAEAASRGVYRSSGLSTSLGDASQRYTRGLADAESQLLGRVADARAQDRQNAIGNVFSFGQGEQANQQLQANILGYLAQLGGQGGPTIPGSIDDYGNLPTPGTTDNSYLYQLLGQLFGPKPATAGA